MEWHWKQQQQAQSIEMINEMEATQFTKEGVLSLLARIGKGESDTDDISQFLARG